MLPCCWPPPSPARLGKAGHRCSALARCSGGQLLSLPGRGLHLQGSLSAGLTLDQTSGIAAGPWLLEDPGCRVGVRKGREVWVVFSPQVRSGLSPPLVDLLFHSFPLHLRTKCRRWTCSSSSRPTAEPSPGQKPSLGCYFHVSDLVSDLCFWILDFIYPVWVD